MHSTLIHAIPPHPPGEGVVPSSDGEKLVLRLAVCMARYGISAYRLEEAAKACAKHLGLEAQIFSTPTAVFAAIGDDESQRTRLLRLDPAEVNLEKQSQVDAVLRDVLDDRTTPAEALARLREIVDEPMRYGPIAMTGAQVLASATVAVFFGGGWREVLGAGLIGLVVGIVLLVASANHRVARLMDFLAGFFAAFTAAGLAAIMPTMPSLVALAGIIVLVPGLTVTTAVAEVATRHLVSGTARLIGALMVFILLGFGVAVGQKAGDGLFAPAIATPEPLGLWATVLALLVAPVGLSMLFRSRPADLMITLPAGIIGFLGARAGTVVVGPEFGAAIGALLVGLIANSWARIADRPSAAVSVPGIMLLVPGSLGFRSIDSFLHNDTLAGVDSAFSMFLVAVGLVTGLLVANAAVSPRRPL